MDKEDKVSMEVKEAREASEVDKEVKEATVVGLWVKVVIKEASVVDQ